MLTPIFLMESLSFIYLYSRYDAFLSSHKYMKLVFPELHHLKSIRDKRESECTYEDSQIPHPFFGYIYHDVGECGTALGFVNSRLDELPSDDHYNILVVGGSLAESFAWYKGVETAYGKDKDMQILIERMFNEKFTGPTGKKIRFHNMAMGNYSNPHQIITLVHSLPLIDAVISIEGYNESFFFTSKERLRVQNNFVKMSSAYNPGPNILSKYLVRGVSIIEKSFFRNFYTSVLIADVVRTNLLKINNDNDLQEKSDLYKSFRRFNTYPDSLSTDEVYELKKKHYFQMLRSFQSIAKANNIHYAIVFQPIIYSKQNLSSEEEMIVIKNKRSFEEGARTKFFTEIIDEILRKSENNANIFDGRSIFDRIDMPIYSDEVHFLMDNGEIENGHHLFVKYLMERVAAPLRLLKKK